jgi:hypothetical protein
VFCGGENFVVIRLSLLCVGNGICRLDVILSQMKRNIITLTNKIVDPINELIFHVA